MKFKLTFIFCLTASLAFSQMNGNYTIDPNGSGSRNFKDFKSAVATLDSNGISSAVIFKIASGTYNEQIQLSSISGSSSKNTVTFESASGDSSKVVLSYPSSNSNYQTDYTLCLLGTSFIVFKKITIERTGNAAYARVILLISGSNFNTICNCRLIGCHTISANGNNTIVYNGANNDSNNIFNQNYLKWGSIGISIDGNNNNPPVSNCKIINNIFDRNYLFGIATQYTKDLIISGNTLKGINNSWAVGIISTSDNSISIINNKVLPNGKSSYGIMIFKSNGSINRKNLIANNMISVGGSGICRGLYIYSSNYTDIVYNSVLNSSLDTNSIGIYSTCSNNKTNSLINNNSFNSGYGLAVAILSKDFASMENNNWYSNGKYLCKLGSAKYSSIINWTKATGLDSNSKSVDPLYDSVDNLHANNLLLNGQAIPYAGCILDIDGQTRNSSHPDIGADELFPPSLDACLSSIDSPYRNYCTGTYPIKVTIGNYGLDTLKSLEINWTMNGTPQPKFSWKSSIITGYFSQLTIGSYSYSGNNYNLKVWINKVNGTTDSSAQNDTLSAVNLKQGLSGIYTIGGTSPDYASFTLAVADLSLKGVCGPVTFNVRNGTYKEQLSISEIAGTSSLNTVTFQSQANDSTAVVLSYPSSSTYLNNFVVQLDGADWITFRKLSFIRTGTNTKSYNDVFHIKGGASNNTIKNNRLIAIKNSSGVNINSATSIDSANSILNNYILWGGTGIILLGGISYFNIPEYGNRIENNIIDSQEYEGIDLYSQDYGIFSNNTIRIRGGRGIEGDVVNNSIISNNDISDYDPDSGITSTGLGLIQSKNINITRNKIFLTSGRGLSIWHCMNDVNKRGLVANNMVSIGKGIYSGWTYAFELSSNNNTDYYYNTGYGSGSNCDYTCEYIPADSNSVDNFENNLFVNAGGNVAIAIGSLKNVNSCNNNCYYSNGKILAQYGYNSYATLSAWKTATNRDSSAISIKPQFSSATDLHVIDKLLRHKGVPVKRVTSDYDGQKRNPTTPDIGADENKSYETDLITLNIISPVDTSCGLSNTIVGVTFFNAGFKNQQNIKVLAEIKGAVNKTLQDTISYFPVGTTYTKYFNSTVDFTAGGSVNIKAYHALANDSDKTDDTIIQKFYFYKPSVTDTPSNISMCGPGYTMLSGTCLPNDMLYWYDSLSSKNPFAVGKKVYTSYLKMTDTFWVQAQPLTGPCPPGKKVPVIVVVDSVPKPIFNTKNVCFGDSVKFLNMTKSSIKSIEWKFGDGSTSTQLNPVHKYTNSGKYNVILTVTNQGGCSDTTSRWVEVYDLPYPDFYCKTTCQGDSAVFTNTSTGAIKNKSWNFGDGNTDTSMNPKHVYVNDGTYTIWLKSTNAEGCSDSISKTIKILARPKVNFTSIHYCNADSVRFTNKTTGQIYSYYWKFGDGTTSSLTNPSHHYTKPGNYVVSLRAISMTSCEDTYLDTITVFQSIRSTIKAVACYSYVFAGKALTKSGVYFDTLTNIYGCDSIITLYLTINKPTSSTLNISSCDYYVFGGKTLTKSGTYSDTLTNAVGCDSIITLNLTIYTVNNTVTLTGKILTATETGAMYQWLDCSNGNKIISGATGQTYTPTLTGDYACIISKKSCTDTSNCVNVVVTGVNELHPEASGTNYELRIYPNPTTGLINLEFSSPIKEDMEVKVYDMIGQLCHAELVEAHTRTKSIDLSGKAKGIYLIECISKEGVMRERVVVE